MKNEFERMGKELSKIRFDKVRIERPYKEKDTVTGAISQEKRNVVGEFRCQLYEDLSKTSDNIFKNEIGGEVYKPYVIHFDKFVDVRAGDYLYVSKNFYLGETYEELEYKAEEPKILKTHIEVITYPDKEV